MTGKQNAPEIRFEGFADPWEQRKLGELMDVTSVRRVHQEDWTDEGVRFLRARDLVAFARNEPIDDPLFISEEMYQEYSALSGKVSVGDLLVTGVGTIGVPWLVTSENPIYFKDGNIIWFKNAGEIDGEFFFHSFIAGAIQSYINEAAGIGTVGTYTIETGKKTPIWLPAKQEQRCVAAFMTCLDNLITLHQRKYDKLCTVKKSMLDKMFPKPGETEPEIRFEGFTDPWEQRKLNECLTVSSEKNSNGAFKRNDVLSVSKDFGVINQIAFQGRSFAGADLSNYGVLNHGEIVYTKSPLKDNPFGIIKSNKSRSGIVSTLYAIYRPLDGTLANFIDCYFSQDARVNNYLHPLISKGAKNDMKVSAENALKGTISIPSVAEQKMICELLAQLDSLITLHQRKLELLRNIKKSLLDRMFV